MIHSEASSMIIANVRSLNETSFIKIQYLKLHQLMSECKLHYIFIPLGILLGPIKG
jgi:hypothetical protein